MSIATAAEAHVYMAELIDKAGAIERKYPDGLLEETNKEDFDEVKRLLAEYDIVGEKTVHMTAAADRKQFIRAQAEAH